MENSYGTCVVTFQSSSVTEKSEGTSSQKSGWVKYPSTQLPLCVSSHCRRWNKLTGPALAQGLTYKLWACTKGECEENSLSVSCPTSLVGMGPKVVTLRSTNKAGEPCTQLNPHTRIFLSNIVLGEEIARELPTLRLFFLLGTQTKTSLFISLKGYQTWRTRRGLSLVCLQHEIIQWWCNSSTSLGS